MRQGHAVQTGTHDNFTNGHTITREHGRGMQEGRTIESLPWRGAAVRGAAEAA